METTTSLGKASIEPESLIGTKWIGWSKFVGDRMMVEFIDEINCIYTSVPNKYSITYTIEGNKLFFGNMEDPFVLRGTILFSRGLPAFKKAY